MKRFWIGLATGLAAAVIVPLLILATGAVNFAATAGPSSIEKTLAQFAVRRSIAQRVPDEQNPLEDKQQAIESGGHHYADTCLSCHGAPGVAPKEFAKGLNPPAPDLVDSLQRLNDAELFWITKNGIRMTGMPALGPTHTDNDIWRIVAFVRHLPNLTEDEKEKLKKSLGEGHQHESSVHGAGSSDDHHDHGDHAH